MTPPIIDHTQAENPYQSLYGDCWEQEAEKSTFLQTSCSINTLITHVFEETKKAFVGTMFEKSGMYTTTLYVF